MSLCARLVKVVCLSHTLLSSVCDMEMEMVVVGADVPVWMELLVVVDLMCTPLGGRGRGCWNSVMLWQTLGSENNK